ncbi:tryptophan halogenase family protein [Gilvimarinus polysaccharolyticus]|uniref:tryptophan halogenase family protein n=1 Tax=Gilvimarinus polysaccharolyticus TaxID=863921 RepID=UPI0006736BE5|nr:tryptophan halogenase family protein [Gilvimarinus polysaccharolyticus]
MINDIVIVGGGSAGWLCAGILAAEFRRLDSSPAIRVSVVESPDVSTIGVGEGTWPTMRATLKKIGLSETDFLLCCNASFKQGSTFVGWKTGAPDDYYSHPFTLPAGFGLHNAHALWQASYPSQSYDWVAGIQGRICDLHLAPKQITMPEFAGALNYGYHLDAGKFTQLLKEHCVNKLGVKHIVDHVEQVKAADNGDISALVTRTHGAIEGELFVDCSGTHSLLLGNHYGVAFKSCRQDSINDRALAVQVPYASDDAEIASTTIATAQKSGWTWDIGLSNRRGVGYVYSSDHADEASIRPELETYLSQSVKPEVISDLTFRSLTFEPGHREKFWHKNCVAVGMSAGFIEPLEASALALVELSVTMIRDELPNTRAEMDIVARRFNEIFSYRWQRIIEFLKLHYLLSERRDSAYWRAATDIKSASKELQEKLELWRSRPPYERDFLHAEEIFPAASYQYVLYGLGFETRYPDLGRSSFNLEGGREAVMQAQKLYEKYVRSMNTNRALLNSIKKHGLKKV